MPEVDPHAAQLLYLTLGDDHLPGNTYTMTPIREGATFGRHGSVLEATQVFGFSHFCVRSLRSRATQQGSRFDKKQQTTAFEWAPAQVVSPDW